MDGDYLITAEAARRLGILACTLRRGDPRPAPRTPGSWPRFRTSDVDAYLRRLVSSAQAPYPSP